MDESETTTEPPIQPHDYVYYESSKHQLAGTNLFLVSEVRGPFEGDVYWCSLHSATGWGSGAYAHQLTLLHRPDPKYLPKER